MQDEEENETRSLVLLSGGSGTKPDKDHPRRSADISAVVRDVAILDAAAKPTVNSVKKMATSFMMRDLLWE
jgi:hypothetical protein